MQASINKKTIQVFLIFCMTICGNGTVYKIDIFFVIFILYIVLFFSTTKINRSFHSIFIYCLAVLMFSSAIYIEPEYNTSYFLWPIKFLLLYIIIISLNQEKNTIKNESLNAVVVFLIVFGTLAIFIGPEIDGRKHFIFGPNMLYRIAAIGLCLSLFLKNQCRLTRLMLLITMATLGVETASKGFWLSASVSTILLAYRIHGIRSWKPIAIFAFVSTTVLLFMIIMPETRLAYFFSAGSNIEQIDRLSFALNHHWYDFKLFGHLYQDYFKFEKDGFRYPHNFAIELVYYYGLIGWMALFLILRSLFKSLKPAKFDWIAAVFFVALLGSCLSGDLSDNYAVLAIAAVFSFNSKHKGYLNADHRISI